MDLSTALAAIGGLGLAGALGTVFFIWRASRWKAIAAAVEKDLKAARTLIADGDRMMSEMRSLHVDQSTRHARIVLWYRAEIGKLEKSLESCNVPGAVRDRLRGMLSHPGAPSGPPALPGSRVPNGSAPAR